MASNSDGIRSHQTSSSHFRRFTVSPNKVHVFGEVNEALRDDCDYVIYRVLRDTVRGSDISLSFWLWFRAPIFLETAYLINV